MLIPKGKPKEDVEKVDVSKAAYISFVGTDSHDWEISILEDLAGNPIVTRRSVLRRFSLAAAMERKNIQSRHREERSGYYGNS
ncbi:MAG: hypothetical protein ACTSSA_12590 [Candidatus Freyarchaeota archaeon]